MLMIIFAHKNSFNVSNILKVNLEVCELISEPVNVKSMMILKVIEPILSFIAFFGVRVEPAL